MSDTSCSVVEYDPRGRVGIGVAQPQSGTDYPFVEPSEDIRYLLADFFFSYDDPSDYPPNTADAPFRQPFRVNWLYGLGCTEGDAPEDAPTPTHDVDLTIVDADGRLVFDSTIGTYETREWGPRLAIHAWETEDAVCRLVAHTKWAPFDNAPEPRDYALDLAPERAVLDMHVIDRRPKRVKSLKVLTADMTKTGIDLVAGYNFKIEHEGTTRVAGGKLINHIGMSVTPGGGLGVFPGCEPTPLYIRAIQGIRPTDAGDFLLGASQCFFVRQPTTVTQEDPRIVVPTEAMLQIGNDCKPCCGCEDYVSMAQYLNEVRDQYKIIGAEFMASSATYHDNRDRWLASAECFQQLPLRLIMQAQYCPTIDIVAQFCNQSDQCVGPLAITIDFTGTDSDGEIMPGNAFIVGATTNPGRRSGKQERYDMGGEWPIFTAEWPSVEPFGSVYVKFRMRFPSSCDVETAPPVLVKGCVSGTLGGSPIMVPDGAGGFVAANVCNNEALDCPAIYPRTDPYRC